MNHNPNGYLLYHFFIIGTLGEIELDITMIAEIGSNWEGDIKKAKDLISQIKSSGANAVKFQMWRAEDLYDPNIPEWKSIKKSELNFETAEQLKKYSDDVGIDFFCSPFYPEAVDFLESLNVKQYKIASRTSALKDTDSLSTLKKVSQTQKPIVMSLGLGGDIKKLKNIFSNNELILCYCIADYPTNFNKIDWKDALQYDGFSDHTLGITAPLIFATLKKYNNTGNIVIEKHIKLSSSVGPDASTSITTDELRELMKHLKLIEKVNI
jgi:N,N'-diacetyllegionaminate synthase